MLNKTNKLKIINDPVYGFIHIPSDLHFDLISHPYMQRLRRLKQLGFSHYVYPGAMHSRFEHVLGAMHLMSIALKEIKNKGIAITKEEEEAAITAILLHDIGHGPLSHTLENILIKNVNHEEISLAFMELMNKEFQGRLSQGIEIFKGSYPKPFLHELVSGQLDTDRLDYLKRDSFFTGVHEGNIGSDRILKMLSVKDGKLVVEAKGIYSVEHFLVARRIMYWQVYLHKTAIAAETMLRNAIIRAKEIYSQSELFTTPALGYFFKKNHRLKDAAGNYNKELLKQFAKLDDTDITISLKEWSDHPDNTLSILSKMLINRDLFRLTISNTPANSGLLEDLKERTQKKYNIPKEEIGYWVSAGKITNKAYNIAEETKIQILQKNKDTIDIAEASDTKNIMALSKPVEKYYLCYPKKI